MNRHGYNTIFNILLILKTKIKYENKSPDISVLCSGKSKSKHKWWKTRDDKLDPCN